ncbi:MAG: hypothetical protein M3162_04835 [Thermoproteota archaeon]|nr:hypothetical protein [Thermoproteota archaeon]
MTESNAIPILAIMAVITVIAPLLFLTKIALQINNNNHAESSWILSEHIISSHPSSHHLQPSPKH